MDQATESRNGEPGGSEHPARDRRRPGRRDFENSALIALLREPRPIEAVGSDDARRDMLPIGIMVGIFIGALALGCIVLLALSNR